MNISSVPGWPKLIFQKTPNFTSIWTLVDGYCIHTLLIPVSSGPVRGSGLLTHARILLQSTPPCMIAPLNEL